MKLKNLLLVCSLFLAGGVVATSGEQANSVKAETKTYEKVTSNLADWSGEYLIVYETGKLIFDGSKTTLDAADNYIKVTITDDKIAADSKYAFTIEGSGSSCTIKSASGYYVGNNSNSNSLSTSTSTKYTNTIKFSSSDNCMDIIGKGGAYLRYNANKGQYRFRYFKSGTYKNQKAIQLYKLVENTGGEAEAKAYTVTLNANGSVSDNASSNVLPENGVYTYTLPACSFEAPAKKVFDSWNTKADGSGTKYAAGDQATLTSESTTFYAQWKDDGKNYINVSFEANGGSFAEGQVTTVEVASGEKLSSYPTATYAGYTFVGWATEDGELVDLNEAITWEEDTTLYAQWEVFVQKVYTLVTSVDELKIGDEIVIANTANKRAMSENQKDNNRDVTIVSIEGESLTYDASSNVEVFELENGTKDDTYAFNAGDGYIYAASSEKNYLRTETKLSDNSSWTIDIDNSGNATVVAQGSYTRNILKFNLNNDKPLFSCYGSSTTLNGDTKVQLYRYNASDVEVDPTPVLPEAAESFVNNKVDSALNLYYSVVDGEYTNFSNLSLLLRVVYDFSDYNDQIEETGLYLTTNASSVDTFVAGGEYTGTKLVDDVRDGQYVVQVDAGDDVARVLNTQLYVCAYVVVDGVTYVTNAQTFSFASMLAKYAAMDGEVGALATAALAYWNAQ